MKALLDRHEIPIQSIQGRERKDLELTITVPVQTDIFRLLKLSPEAGTNKDFLKGAREKVKEWFNEDVAYHLCCSDQSMVRPIPIGYDRFNDAWILDGEPDEHGFLKLIWKHNNIEDTMHFLSINLSLCNQFSENKEFYTPDYFMKSKKIENFIRSPQHPEQLFMDPEKMKSYGDKPVNEKKVEGIAEIIGTCFCSDYKPNMAYALFCRDYTVYYLNTLSEKADKILN